MRTPRSTWTAGAIAALAFLSVPGCSSSGSPGASPTVQRPPTPASTSSRTLSPSVVGSIKPRPAVSSPPDSTCSSNPPDWSTAAPAYDPHGVTPDQLGIAIISVNRQDRSACWDTVNFTVVGGHAAFGPAEYVVPSQVVSDAQGEQLPQVQAPAVVRLTIKAPLHLDDGAPPQAGAQLVPPDQLRGTGIVGVWYGGGQHNQSLFYIGVKAKRPFEDGLEAGPQSSIVDFRLVK